MSIRDSRRLASPIERRGSATVQSEYNLLRDRILPARLYQWQHAMPAGSWEFSGDVGGWRFEAGGWFSCRVADSDWSDSADKQGGSRRSSPIRAPLRFQHLESMLPRRGEHPRVSEENW